MIAALIRWSVANRFLVLLATAFLTVAGLWGLRTTPVDALPDLSDVQVIIRTSWPGQAPQIVENQVTYPLATTMMSVPGAKTVRGFSFFGDSFVYVLFEDGTDLYWARSRVLEYLNQVQGRLPAGAKTALGPDATGVGWIFQYALVDRTGRNDLSQLRALQDWFLKYELKSLPDVAEVASVGGMVRQYQVVLDPTKLVAYGITHAQVREALRAGNQESGGSVLELAEVEYMVRASGYLKTLDDFRNIPLAARGGIPVRLGDVATVQVGPEMRRGIAELDGEGEVAGGVVVLRSGKNAQAAIQAVKTRLAELQPSLPQGVRDRHHLRPQRADRARDPQPVVQAARGVHRRRAGVRAVPVAPALGGGGHHRAAAGRDDRLPGDALAGHQRQHHVAGRHRHRHRRNGRRRGGDDRERAQEDRGLAARASRAQARRRRALAGGHRRGGRGRAGAVLLAADHHAVVHSGVHAAGAGRAAVRPAGLHQDLRDGRGRGAVGDADPGADGLLDPRAHPRRAAQPDHARADRRLSTGVELGAEVAEGHAASSRCWRWPPPPGR